jgi:maleate isomerase
LRIAEARLDFGARAALVLRKPFSSAGKEMAMWRPDGWARTRIGVLTPHADVWPEAEFRAMAPDGISIHAARVPFGAYKPDGTMDPTMADDPARAFAAPPLVDNAAELLASAPLDAIAYGFTSSSYLRGAADDARLKERLEKRTRGIPVVITCASAVTALMALGVTRLALVSPPWFSTEIDQQGARYFQSQGFEVVRSGPAGLPSDQQAIQPGELYQWVLAHTPESAEAVFIGGNGFRAIGVIDALEENLNRPVLTANQVAFWHALALSGSREPVVGYGRIFGLGLPAS